MNKRIVIAGGSGFLGQRLEHYFAGHGWDVIILTRTAERENNRIQWDGRTLGNWAAELEGAAAIVNLSGRTVDCRYNARNRTEIMQSRVESTRVIAEAIAHCAKPPRVWLNASTATLYKHTRGPAWDENGETGATAEANDEFSIEVGRAWETEFLKSPLVGTRKITLRTAMVLGLGKNSVFPVLRKLVRCGLGGKQGTGQQFVSWVHEEDFCRAVEWLIERDEAAGVFNLCAPNPLTNTEMMRAFRQLLRVHFGVPAPKWVLEIGAIFLRTETELVLKSRRVIPGKLLMMGFQFRFARFQQAIFNLNTTLQTRFVP